MRQDHIEYIKERMDEMIEFAIDDMLNDMHEDEYEGCRYEYNVFREVLADIGEIMPSFDDRTLDLYHQILTAKQNGHEEYWKVEALEKMSYRPATLKEAAVLLHSKLTDFMCGPEQNCPENQKVFISEVSRFIRIAGKLLAKTEYPLKGGQA